MRSEQIRKNAKGKTLKTSKINRLYVKGVFLSYKRAQNNQYCNVSLVKLQGVEQRKDTAFYLGKRLAYVYRAQKERNGSKYRVIWGKVCKPHGSRGIVQCRFTKNLPPKAMGTRVRCMLYPSNI